MVFFSQNRENFKNRQVLQVFKGVDQRNIGCNFNKTGNEEFAENLS